MKKELRIYSVRSSETKRDISIDVYYPDTPGIGYKTEYFFNTIQNYLRKIRAVDVRAGWTKYCIVGRYVDDSNRLRQV